MSMEAVTALARQADTHTAKGRRDGFFIMLMYDTGARVSEVLDIRLLRFPAGKRAKSHAAWEGEENPIHPAYGKDGSALGKIPFRIPQRTANIIR